MKHNVMLEFESSFGERGLELSFVDLVSPKEWKNKIDAKLESYNEEAFIENKERLNLCIILKLNPSKAEIDDIAYITGHINAFTNFYDNIINEIKELD